MSEALLISVIEKIDVQERKLEEVSERFQGLPDYTETLNIIKENAIVVKDQLQKIYFPTIKVDELTTTLQKAITLIEHPTKQEVVHHHHASKILWITSILFIIICILSTAIYTSNNTLEMYKENDTKYRYLKLQADKSLNKRFQLIDSMFITNPEIREIVIAKEEQNIRDFEMMQKALRMEREAGELKRKVNAKKK